MKQLNLTTEKLKNSLCPICSLSARIARLSLISLVLISLSSVLSAATVSDLTFKLINGGTEYAVTDCSDSATGALTIPASYEGKPVTEIWENAFEESKLTAVELPEGLRTIRQEAFKLTSIETINLPASLTALGAGAFSYSSSLTGSMTIPSGITEIADSLFYATDLTEVIFHDAVTGIGANAFYATDLASISLPAGLNSIGEAAFSTCTSLSGSVTIPSGITEIPQYLFYNCPLLSEVILDNAVTSIGGWAFLNTNISHISMPYSLKSIGAGAFNGASLESISLPVGLTSIGSAAFRNTSRLAEVLLEGPPPSLGELGFADSGSQVAGGTRFFIYKIYESSYKNSKDWSGFTFTVLGESHAALFEAFLPSTSVDASSTVFNSHSQGALSAASASVLDQHRSSQTEGDGVAVDSADFTESRDSESGVVSRSLSLSSSAEDGLTCSARLVRVANKETQEYRSHTRTAGISS